MVGPFMTISGPDSVMTVKGDRGQAIRQYLYTHGFSSVQAISDAVGASLATIRRDLLQMENEGVIYRTHGGAGIASDTLVEVAFEVREQDKIDVKRAIAEQAYARLRPRCAVFLDASTTVLQLARRLRVSPIPLAVFTNCLNVAQVLIDTPEIEVTLIGGRLRPENASMVGRLAEAALATLRFDRLVIGATAIAPDMCIYSHDEEEASINQRMLDSARQIDLLVDASKFGQYATWQVCPLAAPVTVIADDSLSQPWAERITGAGCPLILASATGPLSPTD